MADSSLDDFFAKKDKSKKSRKFTTSDQIAKKLEEGGKKPAEAAPKKEKEKVVTVPTSTSSTASPIYEQGEDEWRDFEEEKEKDYSGLKIQNLQLSENKDDDYDRERNPDDEDGEYFKSRESMSGPWNKTSSASTPSEVDTERPETPPPPPEPTVEDSEKKEEPKTGVYRPPHARLGTTSANPSVKPRQSKLAPEISSELHFPSLSAAAETPKGSKKSDRTIDSERGFEAVKRGYRTTEEVPCRGPKLDLGNKYNTLSSGDMS